MSLTDINEQPVNARSADAGAVSVNGRVTDLTPDRRNPNRGSERGLGMLEASLRQHGAGRSILVDRNLKIVSGNHVAEVAVAIGLEDCIVVPTDGRKLVVVQRTDLDLDSPAGRALSVADNRTSEIGLSWDTEVLAELAADEAVDLSSLFSPVELADLLHEAAPVPKFQPAHVEHRLDQLADNVRCPRCGFGWHQGTKS